jgi:hypothetical protein
MRSRLTETASLVLVLRFCLRLLLWRLRRLCVECAVALATLFAVDADRRDERGADDDADERGADDDADTSEFTSAFDFSNKCNIFQQNSLQNGRQSLASSSQFHRALRLRN